MVKTWVNCLHRRMVINIHQSIKNRTFIPILFGFLWDVYHGFIPRNLTRMSRILNGDIFDQASYLGNSDCDIVIARINFTYIYIYVCDNYRVIFRCVLSFAKMYTYICIKYNLLPSDKPTLSLWKTTIFE